MSTQEKPRDRFEGNFIESADLMANGGKEYSLTIDGLVEPNVERCANGKVIDRWIIKFKEAEKRFIAGKTNVKILKSMFGGPEEWIGKKVTIGVRYLEAAFGQKNCPTLRIIPPKGTPIPRSAYMHFGQKEPFK